MNEVIHKFKVNPLNMAEGLELPKNAVVRSAGYQFGVGVSAIKIWVKLDPDSTDYETRYFYYIGTGQKIPPGENVYIGMVNDPQGYIWHVHEAIHKNEK